jgi:hypothetical protein
MKMVIIDVLQNKQRIVEDTQIVPRVGERIFLGYLPAPAVTDIVYDFFEEEEIVVRVN